MHLHPTRLSPLVLEVPLFVVITEDTGERGALFYAVQMLADKLVRSNSERPTFSERPQRQSDLLVKGDALAEYIQVYSEGAKREQSKSG